MSVVSVEPPTLQSPGHAMHERIAGLSSYRPLASLLWALAQHAPRPQLLDEIARWPGMDRERATHLLNGLYLHGGLMVLRTHPAAGRGANRAANALASGLASGLEHLRGWRRPGG